MSLTIGKHYLTAARLKVFISGVVMEREGIPALQEGRVQCDKDEHIVYYSNAGRAHDPLGMEFPSDDAFHITGPYHEPEERYFLRAANGSYYGPNSSPVSFESLEKAQAKCEALEWLYHPILFIEQDGVR